MTTATASTLGIQGTGDMASWPGWLAGHLPATTRVAFLSTVSGSFPWEQATVFSGAEPDAARLVSLPLASTGLCPGTSRKQARAPAGHEKVILGRQSHPGAALSFPWSPGVWGLEEAKGAVLGAEVGLWLWVPGEGGGQADSVTTSRPSDNTPPRAPPTPHDLDPAWHLLRLRTTLSGSQLPIQHGF